MPPGHEVTMQAPSGPDGFGPDNLPYGVDTDGHVVVAFGDQAIDLSLLDGLDVGREIWTDGSLNPFFALGPDAWAHTRAQLQASLAALPGRAMRPRHEVSMMLPWEVADYADFYASEAHATHFGQLLRPGTDPLPSAWRHLPIGYHGRAATVIASGEPVPRPRGLRLQLGEVRLGPSERLDVEVELGFVVGSGNARGRPIAVGDAADHIFGVVLVNDWSARDIQAFEYQPLGPFLGKSFATSVSPWVVPLAALAPWRVPGPAQSPAPAWYLDEVEPRGFDIHLELSLNGTVISRTNTAGLYWSMAQQLAHLSANGATVRRGDLFASGTVSGWERGTAGCLFELTENGRVPVTLTDGTMRTWLADGDIATIRGWCAGPEPGSCVSLGQVEATIVDAI